MNPTTRLLLCAVLLAGLSACGNKGSLVQAQSPEAQESDTAATPTPSTTEQAVTQPVTEPTAPVDPATEPAVEEDEPAAADPAEPPPPAADDGTP
jgi:hypothetical protein